MADIDDTIRAIRSNAVGRDKAARAATTTPEALTRPLGLTFAAGDRVLDLITGKEGTVTDGRRQNVIIPAAENAGN